MASEENAAKPSGLLAAGALASSAPVGEEVLWRRGSLRWRSGPTATCLRRGAFCVCNNGHDSARLAFGRIGLGASSLSFLKNYL